VPLDEGLRGALRTQALAHWYGGAADV